MCLDHTTNWKLKPHINYKIYYAQYLWSPPPNTLNSDNTVMHFSYIDRLKIPDNIKIKYHIWWNNTVISAWRTMLLPRFEFPYYFLFLHWFASIFSLWKGQERNKIFISQMYIGKCDFYLFESSTQHTV